MDPEHARLSTGVDEFWDDDDNTSVDFTPRRAHPDTIELVGAPGPPSGLDTNWWDGDGQDALWDAAESDPPAHAPLRAVNAADTGAWSPVLEPAAIATVSFILSFESLRDLAAMSAWPGWSSYLWPLIIDGTIVLATLGSWRWPRTAPSCGTGSISGLSLYWRRRSASAVMRCMPG